MLFFRAITALFLVLTTLNTGETSAVREAAFSTGIDLSAGEMVSTYDDHGGFQGDGTTCTIIQFSDDALLEEIEKAGTWQAFPPDDAVNQLLYGSYLDDVETQEPVAGAVYQIYAKEDIVTGDGTVRANAGDLVGTMTTDAQGMALSEELFLGTYLVKEFDTPDGYELDPTEYEVTLTCKEQDKEIVTEDLEVTEKPTNVTVVKKVLGKDENLKGVKFQIWNEKMDSEIDGGMGMKETYTTDEDGKITVKYLAPGTYCLQEVETIPGYLLDETIRKFEVDENGIVIGGGQITVENDFTKVKISKQDITNGKELPGAKLEVRKEDGTVVEAWTSTDKPHLIEALLEGDYVLRETMAPKGYQVAQDIHFTVKSTGEVQHVVMKDELKEGTIRTNLPDNFRDGSNTNGGIKTGDHAPMGILLAGMGIALAGIVSVIFWKRKKEALDEEA